ncbi:MAG: hypothetical protein HC853_02170 [Anaerolineae bacterium]|nr:hypothetical protein [Anaerolineae bacterium]
MESVVEIELGAFAEETASVLRECRDDEVTDIRVGWVSAQTLPACSQAIHDGELHPLSDEDLDTFTQHLDISYQDVVSSFKQTAHEDTGLLRERD